MHPNTERTPPSPTSGSRLHALARTIHGHGPVGGHGNELFFGDVRWYERFATPLASQFFREIARDVDAALDVPREGRAPAVLDIGTGPGRLVLAIAGRRPDVRAIGVDLSPDMIALARAAARRQGAAGVAFEVADAARLPFADGELDMVVSTFSLHHWQDPRAVVRDCLRVLRPGGRLWVYDLRWTASPEMRSAVREVVATAPGIRPTLEVEAVSLPVGPFRLPVAVRLSAVRQSTD